MAESPACSPGWIYGFALGCPYFLPKVTHVAGKLVVIMCADDTWCIPFNSDLDDFRCNGKLRICLGICMCICILYICVCVHLLLLYIYICINIHMCVCVCVCVCVLINDNENRIALIVTIISIHAVAYISTWFLI